MKTPLRLWLAVALVGCSSPAVVPDLAVDGAGPAADASVEADAALASGGAVRDVRPVACPTGADAPPAGSACQRLTVAGCPGIESEPIDAIIAVLIPKVAIRGTVTHFKGGGGEGFQTAGTAEYQTAGLREVFVSWETDWEQTASQGIKAAGCRPAAVLRWVFAEPTLHAGRRATAFCGEGFSGGSAQLGYALAHYGLGEVLDYVNELSGPPFARIDLGCDGSAPATTTVCGESVTLRLPAKVGAWENIPAPLRCGSTGVPAAELARWKADSIAVGGVYDYPRTRVEFFDCTQNATAVTGMAKLYYDEVVRAEGGTTRAAYHCYAQADMCQGEGLGPRGSREAVQAMIDGCVPRHR